MLGIVLGPGWRGWCLQMLSPVMAQEKCLLNASYLVFVHTSLRGHFGERKAGLML